MREWCTWYQSAARYPIPSARCDRGQALHLICYVLTTNLAFTDWPTVFPNATCATALIDRLVHHADVLAIKGESYRRKEAEADKKSRRKRVAA